MKKFLCSFLSVIMMFVCIVPLNAQASQPISITSVVDNGDSTVTITWDNPNSGKVNVGYLLYDDGSAGNRITADFDISGSSYTFNTLAPGYDYVLLVFQGQDLDNAGMELYSAPAATPLEDFYFSVLDANLAYFTTTSSGSYSYNYATKLSNRKIYDMLDEKDFWVKIDFEHLAHTNELHLPILTVVTAPTGYVIAQADETELSEYVTSFWKTMVYMNDELSYLHQLHGEIPTGEYKVEVYLDGHYVGESSFVIKGE